MTPDRWFEIDALFEEVLGQPPAERLDVLRAACGEDAELYDEVAALLSSVPDAERALGESATAFAAPLLADASADASDFAPGAVLGAYRVVREIGRGGMGRVYLAERDDGVFEKQVALKLVKRGMDTDEVLARFQRERQILAGLDHPGIARLLDGGSAPDGRPFLVMEWVDGIPLSAWADENALDTRARLHLFPQVASAVAYAHRRLVIHRDLKPSNVLVATGGDGAPQVKLLDFGIARLLAEDDGTSTQTTHRRLTPAYAAPEQVRGEAVTTATDVYALGVMLYELLAGARPRDVRGQSASEIEGVLDQPAPLASTRVDAAAAARRGMTPDHLRRHLRGDLDTILSKALQTDPERRYPSVEAFVEDVQRHLRDVPVLARPDSLGYRARRFVRRHRVGVAAALAVAVSLVGGLGAAVWQAGVAERERDQARTEAATAERVTDFLVGLFEDADPMRSGGNSLLALDVVRRGGQRVGRELAGEPVVQADVLEALGRVHRSLGDMEASRRYLDESLAIRRRVHGDAHPETVATLFYLLGTQHGFGVGMGAMQAADPSDSLLAAWRSAIDRLPGGAGPDEAEQMLEVAEYLAVRPRVDSVAMRWRARRMIDLPREALAVYRRQPGPPRPGEARALIKLSSLLSSGYAVLGRPVPPESTQSALLDEGVALATAIGEPALPEQADGAKRRCSAFAVRDEQAARDALPDCVRSRELWLRLGGPEHPQAALVEADLAKMYMDAGLAARGISHAEAAWRIRSAVTSPDDVLALSFRRHLGDVLLHAGRFEDAERHLLASHDRLRELRGDDHFATRRARGNVAALYEAWGRPAEAARWHAEP